MNIFDPGAWTPAQKQKARDWLDSLETAEQIRQAYQSLQKECPVDKLENLQPENLQPENLQQWLLQHTPHDDRRLGEIVAQQPPTHWTGSLAEENSNVSFREGLAEGLYQRLTENCQIDNQGRLTWEDTQTRLETLLEALGESLQVTCQNHLSKGQALSQKIVRWTHQCLQAQQKGQGRGDETIWTLLGWLLRQETLWKEGFEVMERKQQALDLYSTARDMPNLKPEVLMHFTHSRVLTREIIVRELQQPQPKSALILEAVQNQKALLTDPEVRQHLHRGPPGLVTLALKLQPAEGEEDYTQLFMRLAERKASAAQSFFQRHPGQVQEWLDSQHIQRLLAHDNTEVRNLGFGILRNQDDPPEIRRSTR